MIHYHGGPITPNDAALAVWRGRHAFVSFWRPDQIALAAEYSQTFALDNGAFSAWRSGKAIADWRPYYEWSAMWLSHPGCDWAVIPDVIDGAEEDNDRLLAEWPHGRFRGVPVWHLHESMERLGRLASEWPRVALGSSGAYSSPGSQLWRARMDEAMEVVCDGSGRPRVKLHGLRQLSVRIFPDYPYSSCDSTNVARNTGIDQKFDDVFKAAPKAVRALAITTRVEQFNSAPAWKRAA